MKKILGLLILISLLMLYSCGGYPAVESTKQEAEVMFTLEVGDREYDVRYELYRAFFLTHKREVDGGDDTVWSGADKAEYVERMNEIILPKIANIYATINLAEDIGVDFSSKAVKEQVESFIEISVEGGNYNGETLEGYGSYDKYLAALKSSYLNYSVQVLLYHYVIAQSEIAEYYIGTLNEDNVTPDATKGHIEYTRDDIWNYYKSDECVRVLRAFIQDSSEAQWRAQMLRDKMDEATDIYAGSVSSITDAISIVIIQNTFMSETEAFGGMVIGKYSLDSVSYGELTDAAFGLDSGEVSDVLEITAGEQNGYHILYKADKTVLHFDEYYVDVVDSYLNNEIGRMIDSRVSELLSDIDYEDEFEELDYSTIRMD